jgi:hypothetical protein
MFCRLSRLIIILSLIACTTGCNTTPESLNGADYVGWISSEKKGFVKTKKVNTVTITSRYMPAAFLAYREFMNGDYPDKLYDSIYNSYKCSVTFQFTMHADRKDKSYGNLKYYNIASQEELAGRVRFLNFSAAEFFLVEWNGAKYYPVLSVFEGFDELENKLSFSLVFQIPGFNCSAPPDNFDNVNFVFDDPLWGLGTNNFLFQNAVFQNKPKLSI